MIALLKFNTNEYIIEWLRKTVDVLINDKQEERSKLILE